LEKTKYYLCFLSSETTNRSGPHYTGDRCRIVRSHWIVNFPENRSPPWTGDEGSGYTTNRDESGKIYQRLETVGQNGDWWWANFSTRVAKTSRTELQRVCSRSLHCVQESDAYLVSIENLKLPINVFWKCEKAFLLIL